MNHRKVEGRRYVGWAGVRGAGLLKNFGNDGANKGLPMERRVRENLLHVIKRPIIWGNQGEKNVGVEIKRQSRLEKKTVGVVRETLVQLRNWKGIVMALRNVRMVEGNNSQRSVSKNVIRNTESRTISLKSFVDGESAIVSQLELVTSGRFVKDGTGIGVVTMGDQGCLFNISCDIERTGVNWGICHFMKIKKTIGNGHITKSGRRRRGSAIRER